MMLSFCFTDYVMTEEGRRHATERSNVAERQMRWVSERRTAADRMYTDGRCNDLSIKADRGHILILVDLLSSYAQPYFLRC